MSAHCREHETPKPEQVLDLARYRRVLWIALLVNVTMVLVELGAGYRSSSASLLADAIDFAGDAANYAVSLAVLSAAIAWCSRAALLKAACMIRFGLFDIGRAAWGLVYGGVPNASRIGAIGVVAQVANLSMARMLYAFCKGDANMRSVWLCTRNDAFSNIAVIAAAIGVFASGSAWPDLAVAAIMAGLAISGGWSVMRQARGELTEDAHHGHAC